MYYYDIGKKMGGGEIAESLARQDRAGERDVRENPFKDHEIACEKGIDNLEDMIDLFWEQPFAFSTFVHSRYTEEMTDAFAGRIYESEHQPSKAIMAFRKMLKRERTYDEDDYSVPIGSRYHEERAALWEPETPVETTEEWIQKGSGVEPAERAAT